VPERHVRVVDGAVPRVGGHLRRARELHGFERDVPDGHLRVVDGGVPRIVGRLRRVRALQKDYKVITKVKKKRK